MYDLTMGLTVVSTSVLVTCQTYVLVATLSDGTESDLGRWYKDEPQLSLSNASVVGKLLDEALHNCKRVARSYHGLSFETYQPMFSPVDIKAPLPVVDWDAVMDDMCGQW